MDLDRLVSCLDGYLQILDHDDRSNNGRPLEGLREVYCVPLAVGAYRGTFTEAAPARLDLLSTAHGVARISLSW